MIRVVLMSLMGKLGGEERQYYTEELQLTNHIVAGTWATWKLR